MSVAVFAGVDGGGSHTTAVIGTSAREPIGRGGAGPCNPQAVGFDRAVEGITSAIGAALSEAQRLEPTAGLAGVALGIAGAGRPGDRATLEERIAAGLGLDRGAVRCYQDVALLLPAAGLSTGIALVAGTGSSAFGLAPDGRVAVAGGWGYLIGDDGSGYAVGREALRLLARADDGLAARGQLVDEVMTHFGISRCRDVVTAVYQSTSPRNVIAGLAPIVVAADVRGDQAAHSILTGAGKDLAAIAIAVVRQLGLGDDLAIVATGGLISGSPTLRQALATELDRAGSRDLRGLDDEPALGALRLATGEIVLPTIDVG